MRDKLIELIIDGFRNCTKPHEVCSELDLETLADYLIAHGVTVQKWIPVSERLPDKNRKAVLIALRWEETDIGWYNEDDKCWQSEFINSYDDGDVTHWMPLPKAPKEVE